MNNPELNEKIKQIEQSIQNIKAILKSWANKIGEYHKTLKELSCQLATLKKQTETNMKNNKPNNNQNTKENNNNKINPKGGNK
ncbi:MAG: hypothetical protein MRECE_2c117 [Mycoplasmataceae bacterium CE_OT135]|nr:MAG: hypothetical protein MRECE_2c117 [Mycoplasmataceae bacterium CE_OT135]